MITKSYLKKLASIGYSIIPVESDKRPKGSWKEFQTKHRTSDEIELLDSPLFGLVTGYNNIECIDVDLKVIVGLKDQKEWFDEYIAFLSDNIEDFSTKFVIAKTKNAGYHILYKCQEIQGNTKIAKLEDSKEAILESRGIGGMIVLYDYFHSDLEYHDIKEISVHDRNVLWSISKTYNYIAPEFAEVPKKSEYTPTNETEISPWEDYNSKTNALDLVSDEFKIVRNTTKTYVIKRNGAESPHSGYIFKDSGCMFLFTTGTHYPNEKLLSPFGIYCYRYHNGDFTKGASELYKNGFGSRKLSKTPIQITPAVIEVEKDEQVTRVQFPIEIFPIEIQNYIVESSKTLGMSVDFMGCAFLWMLSVIIGNSLVIEVKPGWVETATLWIAVVGKPGIGKTPSINQMIFPLKEQNVKEQKQYQKNYAKWIEYEKLEKKEKAYHEEIQKPTSKQFIVGDITLEALVDLHEENPNAIGVFKDELAGWFKDMNKYRAGSDLEFWLSSWSGQSISLNRKTAKSAFVDKPFIPVLGGIQPSIFEEFATGVNKENGFVDRILISYPELRVNKYNTNSIDYDVIEWYRDFVYKFRETVTNLFYKISESGELLPTKVKFNKESNPEWVRIHDRISNDQNSDNENEFMKSMLPKQKSYIPRFALVLNTLESFFDESVISNQVHKESILKAEKLSDYFVNMAKLVKQDAKDKNDLKRISQAGLTPFDKFKAMYLNDKEINRTTASELLEVSKRTVYKWIKKLEQ
tara:strand:+ start:1591 stop:3834 length:2244 start_codon:yes stop_codon:yes gene_type:complete